LLISWSRKNPFSPLIRLGGIGLLVLAMARSSAQAAGLETELEKIIGRQVAALFESQLGRERSPTLNRWIRRLGEDLARASPRQDIRYTFVILNTGEANAYASPGAHLFITRGLLDAVESEDELAAIIAHEVGHVARRHAMRQIETQVLMGIGIGAIRGKNRDAPVLVARILNALTSLHMSRRSEAEADRDGFEIAYRAGYNPAAMLSFFERIARGRRTESKLERLFATHPEPSARIAQARRNPWVVLDSPQMQLHVAQGYARRGLYTEAAAHYRTALRLDPSLVQARRGLACSLTALGERDEAILLWEELKRSSPDDPAIQEGLQEAQGLPPEEPKAPARLPGAATEHSAASDPELTQLRERARKVLQRLDRVYRSHRATASLQQSLLASPVLTDARWAYLAYEAYEAVELIEDASAKALGSATGLPDLYAQARQMGRRVDRMEGLPEQLQKDSLLGAEVAARSCLSAITDLEKGIRPLEEAERTIGAVLLDLNSPLLLRSYNGSWTRFSLEESLVLYAKRCIQEASRQVIRSHKQTALAQLMLLQKRVDRLMANAGPRGQRIALHCLQRWLPAACKPTEMGFGTWTLLLALAQETGQTPEAAQATTPEERIQKIEENSENLYTILRMVEKEIVKETSGSGSEQSTVDYRPNRGSSFSDNGMAAPQGGTKEPGR